MRESRTYGSGRGACHEMHVPTATTARVHHAARRRGGVAAGGTGAAAGDAGDLGLPCSLRLRGSIRDAIWSAFRGGMRELGYVEGRKRRYRVPVG